MVKFLYYLAAFGEPNISIKYDVLIHNINYIHENIKTNFDLFVNVYDKTYFENIINTSNFTYLNEIIINKQKGILSELWINNPYHKNFKKYDYIFFILDDVKIEKIDILSLINIKLNNKIDVISPRVKKSTWSYMKGGGGIRNSISITSRLEIFCLLLTYFDFIKFISMNDIQNSNIWGVDYMFPHYKLKTAICNKFTVEHVLKSNSDHAAAIEQMERYIINHGYNSRDELIREHPNDIVETIDLNN